jgi:predicted kinase
VLVVFSGLPGTGKSELAQGLARRLHIPVLSVDPVEAALLRAGIPQSFETGLAAYLVVEALADAQLALGADVIVDAVNSVEPAKEMWRKLASQHGVPLRVIECRCSDEARHRERLATRRRGISGLPEPSWETVQQRRREFTPWVEPHLSVDAVASSASNVERILEWLQEA